MTHFIGAVLVPAEIDTLLYTTTKNSFGISYQDTTPTADLKSWLDTALAKFDENTKVPRYVEYTREALIAKGRAEIESYRNGLYAQYLADPVAYRESRLSLNRALPGLTGPNEADPENGLIKDSHLDYIENKFPKKLTWTDEEVYNDEIRWIDKHDIGPDGETYSTYNPHSRWDWWTIGGRWTDEYKDRQGETLAKLREEVQRTLDNLDKGVQLRPQPKDGTEMEDPDRKLPWWFPKNLVIPVKSGEPPFEWLEQHKVGWWGTTGPDTMSEREWLQHIMDKTADLSPDIKVIYIDFHI